MKKLFYFTIILLCYNLPAQTIEITFTGTGASENVSSVLVNNLQSGQSLILSGNDILRLNLVTGIQTQRKKYNEDIKIFPNPTTDNSIIRFCPFSSGNAEILVSDNTGVPVVKGIFYLENTLQEFQLSGLNKGFYLIKIIGAGYRYSGKIVCSKENVSKVAIIRISGNSSAFEKTVKNGSKGLTSVYEMPYVSGERLLFKGFSLNYTTVLTDVPTSDKNIQFNFITCTDGSGNDYPIVRIGTKYWMADNLKSLKYRNGDLIGTTAENLEYSTDPSPKYQWAYNNQESLATIYGRLYTWYAVTDSRSVCPVGWHLPSNDEWNSLISVVGGTTLAGGKLKETGTTHWFNPNSGATNEFGFTAFPGGYKSYRGSDIYTFLNYRSFLWSSTENNSETSYNLYLNWDTESGVLGTSYKKAGNTVRCIYDF